jgi:16S rRNA (cytidine1402-2'-O)-methyltransferase
VSILYLVGVPAGNREHLTLRARRLLKEVRHIIAEDADDARALLADLDVATLPAGLPADGTALDLLQGGDVALLVYGWPGEAGRRLVQAAVQRGHEVLAVPGPALPITALILSGLPADTFVYLGELSPDAAARRRWLAAASGEGCTLVAVASAPLLEVLSDLYDELGDRPLVVVPSSSLESRSIWRGSLATAAGEGLSRPCGTLCALVIGGSHQAPEPWDEQRLAAEIDALLARGHRAKEISRQLTEESGWSRRRVYDLVVEMTREVSSQ